MDLKKIRDKIENFKGKKILVIGDLMIDHYLWGDVERISPEAPVPVVSAKKEEHRLGGAANVVNNLKALGAEPIIMGICGDDQNGEILKKLFTEKNISSDFIIKDNSRKTTIKTRILTNKQQIVRVDYENLDEIDSKIEKILIEKAYKIIPEVDAILFEDYNKGLLTKNIISKIIKKANKYNKIITVDPKFTNFFEYKNVTVFKPNLNELEKNMSVKIKSEQQFIEVCEKLLKKIKAKYLVITRGSKGLSIFSKKGQELNIPTFAREVFDVSGAGDTVISTLTLGMIDDNEIKDSAIIANHAAGEVCRKVGIIPAEKDDILNSFKYQVRKNNGK